MVKNLLASAGDLRDAGSFPGSGIPPGEGNSNPLQYPYLGNSMDRGAWWATVRGVPESDRTIASTSSRLIHVVCVLPFCVRLEW